MGLKRLLIALVLLGALGAAVYFSGSSEKKDDAAAGADTGPVLLETTAADLRKVEVRRRDGSTLAVESAGNGQWRMTAPEALPVDSGAVMEFLGTLTQVRSQRIVDEKPANIAEYGLAQPRSVVTVTRKNGQKHTLKLGELTPGGSSVYVQVAGDPRLYTAPASLESGLDKKPNQLRDRRLVRVDAVQARRVEVVSGGQTLTFAKDAAGDWAMTQPEASRAEGSKVEDLIARTLDARMDADAAPLEDSVFAAAKPVGTVRLVNGGTHTLEIRRGADNTLVARGSDLAGVHKAPDGIAELLARPADEYRTRNLFSFGFIDPDRVTVTASGKTSTFERSGNNWKSGGTVMDTAAIQSMLDKVRGLTAVGFATGTFGTPNVTVAVTSDQGKRAETVQIAGTVARRADGPTLYQLDQKVIDELVRAAGDVRAAKR